MPTLQKLRELALEQHNQETKDELNAFVEINSFECLEEELPPLLPEENAKFVDIARGIEGVRIMEKQKAIAARNLPPTPSYEAMLRVSKMNGL